jgi:hypothetical protein
MAQFDALDREVRSATVMRAFWGIAATAMLIGAVYLLLPLIMAWIVSLA